MKILNKLKNTKSIISLVSLIILLFATWGIDIPNEKILTTVRILCSIGVMLGVLNDTGMKTDKWNI